MLTPYSTHMTGYGMTSWILGLSVRKKKIIKSTCNHK